MFPISPVVTFYDIFKESDQRSCGEEVNTQRVALRRAVYHTSRYTGRPVGDQPSNIPVLSWKLSVPLKLGTWCNTPQVLGASKVHHHRFQSDAWPSRIPYDTLEMTHHATDKSLSFGRHDLHRKWFKSPMYLKYLITSRCLPEIFDLLPRYSKFPPQPPRPTVQTFGSSPAILR